MTLLPLWKYLISTCERKQGLLHKLGLSNPQLIQFRDLIQLAGEKNKTSMVFAHAQVLEIFRVIKARIVRGATNFCRGVLYDYDLTNVKHSYFL